MTGGVAGGNRKKKTENTEPEITPGPFVKHNNTCRSTTKCKFGGFADSLVREEAANLEKTSDFDHAICRGISRRFRAQQGQNSQKMIAVVARSFVLLADEEEINPQFTDWPLCIGRSHAEESRLSN
jgi:hypothetical protein